MRATRALASLGAIALALVITPATPARAANSPTFRDCSLIAGLDPDFVEISLVTVTPQGTLTVPASQRSVDVEASESSDPGDNLAHVTLSVTVSRGQTVLETLNGAGTGRVVLSVPLPRSGGGKTFTIGWAAVFDSGNHPCPSPNTPQNTAPNPFVVTVG